MWGYGGGMREPIEGEYRVIGEPPKREPVFHMRNLIVFVLSLAFAIGVNLGLRQIIAWLGYSG